ncbi:hypothetical protein G9A89_016539 [Geosiphon pyriformis]|nr:hypothetical protein G9A89_016539 [Geosiphon pyriformis]
MTTSLSIQLKKIANGDALRATQTLIQKHRASFLFDSKQAADYDLNTIHSIGIAGLEELKKIDQGFAEYEDTLFSEAVKNVDRVLQTEEENKKLNKCIARFLRCLSPYFLVKPAGKVLEWLIRRFRIQEFNIDDIMACILPYHDTKSFVLMASLLKIEENNKWGFIKSINKTRQPIDRSLIVQICIKDRSILDFICKTAVKSDPRFKIIISFYAAVVIEYVQSVPKITESDMTLLLPYLLSGCKRKRTTELRVATYMIACQISSCVELAYETLSALFVAILRNNPQVELNSLLCIIHICQTQGSINTFPEKALKYLRTFPNLEVYLAEISQKYAMDRFLESFFSALILDHSQREFYGKIFTQIFQRVRIPSHVVVNFCTYILEFYLKQRETQQSVDTSHINSLLRLVQIKYPQQLNMSLDVKLKAIENSSSENLQKTRDELYELLSNFFKSTGHEPLSEARTTLFLSVNHAESNIRMIGLKKVVDLAQEKDSLLFRDSSEFIKDTLLARLRDDNEEIVSYLLSVPNILITYVPSEQLLPTLLHIVNLPNIQSKIKRKSLTVLVKLFWELSENPKSAVLPELLKNMLITNQNKKLSLKLLKELGKLRNVELLNGVDVIEVVENSNGEQTVTAPIIAANIRLIKILADNLKSSKDFEENIKIYLQAAESESIPLRSFALLVLNRLTVLNDKDHEQSLIVIQSILDRLLGNFKTSQINIETVDKEDLSLVCQEGLPPYSLMDTIVSGLNLPVTEIKVELFTLMNLLTALKPIVYHKIAWMIPEGEETSESEKRYRSILVQIYRAIPGGPTIARYENILRIFFETHFPNDPIQFCCSFLTDDLPDTTILLKLRSLYIANAYITAHSRANVIKDIDFQMILPSFLISLADPNKAVRNAALTCIASIDTFNPVKKPTSENNISDKKPKENLENIFLHKDFYRKNTDPGEQVVLSNKNFSLFVKKLSNYREELLADHNYIQRFLAGDANDQKYDHESIISFLLSHIIALQKTTAQIKLVELLSRVDSSKKLQALYPLMETSLSLLSQQNEFVLKHEVDKNNIRLLKLLIKSVTAESVDLLNNDKKYSDLFVGLLRSNIFPTENDINETTPSISLAALSQIKENLFVKLNSERQQEILGVLFDLVTSAAHEVVKASQETLKRIFVSSSLIVPELNRIEEELKSIRSVHLEKIDLQEAEEPPTKRSRNAYTQGKSALIENSQGQNGNEQTRQSELIPLKRLIAILEFLQYRNEPIKDLSYVVAPLFNVMEVLTNFSPANPIVSRDYIVEMILSSLTNIFKEKGLKIKALDLNSALIFYCLRSSSNPKVQNQLLLLLSAMVALHPSHVVQNTIPVFRFLEDTGLQRNDDFSAYVIHQTIQNLIPALLKSYKQQDSAHSHVFQAKPILQVFVNTLFKMPKCRRVGIFSILIRTLGENDFLFAILGMLLAKHMDKFDQSEIPTPDSLSDFCLLLLKEFPLEAQVKSLVLLIQELLQIPNEKPRFDNVTDISSREAEHLFEIDGQTAQDILEMKLATLRLIRHLFTHDGFLQQVLEKMGCDSSYEAQFEDLNFKLTEVVLMLFLNLESFQGLLSKTQKKSTKSLKELSSVAYNTLSKIHAILTIPSFVRIVRGLLGHQDLAVRTKAMELLNERLVLKEDLDEIQEKQVVEIVSDLTNIIATDGRNTEYSTLLVKQNAMICLSTLVHQYFKSNETLFTESIVAVIGSSALGHVNIDMKISSIACLAHLCQELSTRIVPYLPKFMPQLLHSFHVSLTEKQPNYRRLQVAILLILEEIMFSVPSFITPYLPKLLESLLHPATYTNKNEKDDIPLLVQSVLSKIATDITPRILFPLVFDIYQTVLGFGKKSLITLLQLLQTAIKSMPSDSVLNFYIHIFKFLLILFDYRRVDSTSTPEDVDEIENQLFEVFYNLILKLNDNIFKPLFLKLVEWATIELTQTNLDTPIKELECRLMILFRLVDYLLIQVEHLFAPYYVYVLDASIATLQRYKDHKQEPNDLWIYIVDSLQKYFLHDQQALQNSERFKKIMYPIVEQLLLTSENSMNRIAGHLVPCLGQLAINANDDDHRKMLNKHVLLQTQNNSPEVRMAAILVLSEFYKRLGESFVIFLPETVTYLVELLEDIDHRVEKLARELISIIEAYLGQSFQEYIK